MLGNRAHEGLQPPSNLEERKGLKKTQHAAHVRSAAHPHPPRTRGVISASLEGSPPKPSTAPRASASLEATPRRKRQTAFPLTCPLKGGINANYSSTALGSDGVRPTFPTVAVTGVLSANPGHCSAIPDAVTTLWEPAT